MVTAWPGATPTRWPRWPGRSRSARVPVTSLPRARGKAAKKLGHPEFAMACKDQGIPAYDPRGIKGMGMGYATSNPGACHLRGYTPAAEVGATSLAQLTWGSAGLGRQGQPDHDLPERARHHRLPGRLQIRHFLPSAGSVRGSFAAITGIALHARPNCSRAASASTTWSATTTT